MTGNKPSSCPYFSNDADCLMINDGIYIPLPQHIKMFCQRSSFTKCHHYIHGRKPGDPLRYDEESKEDFKN